MSLSPSTSTASRLGSAIIQEMLDVTREMMNKQEDADFLISSVEKRQQLMLEYDRLSKTDPDSTSVQLHPELKKMAKEIMHLDSHLSKALGKHLEESKEQLKDNHQQQKVLGYLNNAISASGSYMDVKK